MVIKDASGISTSGTRWEIIKALRSLGQATVNEITRVVDVKGMTVRHHLTSLQAEGLVEAEAERRAVGRPAYVFRLTQKAQQLFPQTYHLLIDRLLDQLKIQLDADTVEMLINALADSFAEEVRHQVDDLSSPTARREQLILWLEQKGLSARWQESGDGLQLVKYHCPYYAVGQRHPELCQIDEALVRKALDADVERAACLLHGDESCTLLLPSSGASFDLPQAG